MLLYSKVNMDSVDEADARLIKHPRWSPSPVDLSVAANLTPQSALLALGAQPTPFNLNNMLVRGPHLSNQVLNTRKQREFIPDSKKDDSYWDRRKRNNEAAKRSREKRRISDMVLETRVLELSRENAVLRAELYAIKEKFSLSHSQHFIDPETVSLSIPEGSHRGRRNKLLTTIISTNKIELHNPNGSLSSYTSSSSPTSSHSSDSTLSPTITNLNNSPLNKSMSTTRNVHSPPSGANNNTNTNTNNNNNASSLPFKLRHKAKNTTTDSDSGSDSGTAGNDHMLSSNGINGNCGEIINYHDTALRSENYTLRSELQRLASEVASLKNVLVCAPSGYTLSCHNNQGESRSNTPLMEPNDLNELSVSTAHRMNELEQACN